MQQIPLKLIFEDKELIGTAQPYPDSIRNEVPYKFNISLNSRFMGILECKETGWQFENKELKNLADIIGDYIVKWYE